MRPAFSSTRQAALFTLLLLGLLLSPVIAGKKGLPSREEIYSSIWWESGDFPYLHQQIFNERGDIDILFIGASHIHTAIDTSYVRQKFSEELKRPVVARTLGWGGGGYDELYFVTRDLLEHRKVRMLVFDDVFTDSDQLHILTPHFFRFGDDADVLTGLPFKVKAAFYFASVMGMPRNLLQLCRSNLGADLVSPIPVFGAQNAYAPNPATRLGAFDVRLGFNYGPHFEDYSPLTGVQPSSVHIYSPATTNFFTFSDTAISPVQLYFVRKFAALAQDHGCQLVLLHIPTFEERHSAFISERAFWPRTLNTNVTMIGICPTNLFRGLTDDEIRKLFTNPDHFNENGQKYFTRLLTPTLLQIYDSQAQR